MNTPEQPSNPKYKRYDEAFKRQAVEQWLLSGKACRVVAAELGVSSQTLHSWKQHYKGLPAQQVAGTLANTQYKDALQPGWHSPDGQQVLTKFQGQPALLRFSPGSGEHQAIRGTYSPYLVQEVTFERGGQWFSLMFCMRNADKNKPYYTEPLPIVQQYFETFRYKPPTKGTQH